MRVEEVLEELGGVASGRELRGHFPNAAIRSALRRGRIVRDGRGRYSLPGTEEARRVANRLSGVLCWDSAAAHYGWKLKTSPESPAVAVPRKRHLSPRRREGVRVWFVDVPVEDVDGIATTPVRTVMDCAGRLPFDEALVIADSALRNGDVSNAELAFAAERMPRRYRARCRRVAREASEKAANPFESVLRAIALQVPGLDVKPQTWVSPIGHCDLGDKRLRLAIEADSFEFHGKRPGLVKDCRRYNAFVINGWLVLRFAWEHVMFEPDYVHRVLVAVVQVLDRRFQEQALADREARVPA